MRYGFLSLIIAFCLSAAFSAMAQDNNSDAYQGDGNGSYEDYSYDREPGFDLSVFTYPDGEMMVTEIDESVTLESHPCIEMSPEPGDYNCDGQTEVSEVSKSLRMAVGLEFDWRGSLAFDIAPLAQYDGVYYAVANGKVDIGDVLVLLRMSVGLIEESQVRWPRRTLEVYDIGDAEGNPAWGHDTTLNYGSYDLGYISTSQVEEDIVESYIRTRSVKLVALSADGPLRNHLGAIIWTGPHGTPYVYSELSDELGEIRTCGTHIIMNATYGYGGEAPAGSVWTLEQSRRCWNDEGPRG